MTTLGHARHRDAEERGSAMLITMMIVALVVALATTVMSVTVNNLRSARRSADAALALDAADAGVAQALAYLRHSGVHGLACSPTCTSNPWGNSTTPATETIGARGQSFTAWIEQISAYSGTEPGRYRVHAVGRGGEGVRAVEVDVMLGATTSLPLGVFARSVNGGGTATVTRESVFSTGCVYNRGHIAMAPGEVDLAYNIPVAVHSSQYISESNGNNQTCAQSSRAIHRGNVRCNTSYPHDQDILGGSLTSPSTACASTQSNYPTYYAPRDLNGDGSIDVNGSYLRDETSLRALFNIRPQPFTPAQLDDLRATARSQGTYFTSSTGWTSPNPAVNPHSVLFFDLAAADPGGTVDLNAITGWGRNPIMTPSNPLCLDRSLLIIIEGGNARLNSNQRLAAHLVLTSSAPYGQVVRANGNASFIGTIYADTVNLVGTLDISLDACFMSNLSPGLLEASPSGYREIDR